MSQTGQKEINVLFFNTRDEFFRVDLRKVGYFKADRNYTDIYFLNGYHEVLPLGLMAIEQMLNVAGSRDKVLPFVRIGRSLIVNLSYIVHINVPRQELVISDCTTPQVLRLEVPKESLRKLKELYNQKKI